MKYITVTMNPAIDQSYVLSSPLKKGILNRASQMSTISYSGKGINVSRALLELGKDSKVLCLLREDGGEEMYSSLLKENLNLFEVRVPGRTRRNISVVEEGGGNIEINEPGESVDLEEALKFFSLYDKLVSQRENKTVFICGSAPPGFRDDIYKRLVMSAKKSGAHVALDADGELLRRGIEGSPDLIKPNEKELFSLTGCRLGEDAGEARIAALAAATVIYEKKGVDVLCTLGEKGSVYAGKEGKFLCPPVPVKAKRFKGAGDVYLARFVYERQERGRSVLGAMKIASEATSRFLES